MESVDNEIWKRTQCNECIYFCLNQALINKVTQSSMQQTVKAMITAGFGKSIYYLLRKMWKHISNTSNKNQSVAMPVNNLNTTIAV